MSSPQNQTKTLTRQSLAERCFSSATNSREARGGGIFLTEDSTTLLDNWNTGTTSPLRRTAKSSRWQDCLAKRTFKSEGGLSRARSGGGFPTNLLDNWNTGTLLSPQNPFNRAAETICLAGQRFWKPSLSGLGVAAFPFFKNFCLGLAATRVRQTAFTG
jgi:hypothetical protein